MRHPTTALILFAGVSALSLSGPAVAGSTRAANQHLPPTASAQAQPVARPGGAPAVQASGVGPPGGFPHAPGLDRAREVANDNAAFNRPDSPGG